MKDLKREYNRIKREEFPWALEVTKCAPEQEFAHLSAALTNYFRMHENSLELLYTSCQLCAIMRHINIRCILGGILCKVQSAT